MNAKLILREPINVWLGITSTCNLACRFCYSRCTASPPPGELSKREWLALLDHLESIGVIQVMFEGGEPFYRPDFLDILAASCPRFLTWVRTNGTLITPGLARRLKSLGLGTAVIDLWGAHPETHDYLTGVRGSYQSTIAGIRNALNAEVPVVLTLVVTRQNLGELQEYVDLAHELGVRRVGFLRLYPLGRAKDVWSELVTVPQAVMSALERLRVPDGMQVMHSWHPNDKNCCWQSAAIDAFGNSIGCSYLRGLVNFGNVREVPFEETWRHALYMQLRSGEVAEYCEECYAHEATKGGCRSLAYAFSGRWDAPDPFCPHMNGGVDVRELPEWFVQKGTRG